MSYYLMREVVVYDEWIEACVNTNELETRLLIKHLLGEKRKRFFAGHFIVSSGRRPEYYYE